MTLSSLSKYINYHKKFKDYVNGFQQAQEDLKARKGDVQMQLQGLFLKPTVDNRCKFVLTTRSEVVVRAMDCSKVQIT